MDYYSRFVEVQKLTSTTSSSVIVHLKAISLQGLEYQPPWSKIPELVDSSVTPNSSQLVTRLQMGKTIRPPDCLQY